MTKHCVKIPCGDGSTVIAWYTYSPGHPATRMEPEDPPEWDLVELYHELPMEGKPPTASLLTNLHGLIDAVCTGDPPFEGLYDKIEEAIAEAQRE